MPQELEAIFDRTALQLEAPLNLAAGTRVRIVIESVFPGKVKPPKTFLKTAQSLKLQAEVGDRCHKAILPANDKPQTSV